MLQKKGALEDLSEATLNAVFRSLAEAKKYFEEP
jgi:hypothetical protein